LPEPSRFAWDIYHRDDRFIVYRGRLEILATLFAAALGLGATIALLAITHRSIAARSLLIACAIYAVVLIGSLKLTGRWASSLEPVPLLYFAVSGLAAGVGGVLARGAPDLQRSLPLIAAAFVLGGFHWFCLRVALNTMVRYSSRHANGGLTRA
jgi:hypothetical protein